MTDSKTFKTECEGTFNFAWGFIEGPLEECVYLHVHFGHKIDLAQQVRFLTFSVSTYNSTPSPNVLDCVGELYEQLTLTLV